jgi:hypothetical protein
MSTVHNGKETVITARRRPAATSSGARQIQKIFGNDVVKKLPILDFIDKYNHYMGGVDIADQLRSYFTTQRVHCKTWKPLFHFLIDTAVINSYRLSSYYNITGYIYGHKKFRKDLRDQLFKHSQRHRKPPILHKSSSNLIFKPIKEHKLEMLGPKQLSCAECCQAGRKSEIAHMGRRKPLADLSNNTTMKSRDGGEWKRRKRAPRTKYGCSVCRIPLCTAARCWDSHIARLSSKE